MILLSNMYIQAKNYIILVNKLKEMIRNLRKYSCLIVTAI